MTFFCDRWSSRSQAHTFNVNLVNSFLDSVRKLSRSMSKPMKRLVNADQRSAEVATVSDNYDASRAKLLIFTMAMIAQSSYL